MVFAGLGVSLFAAAVITAGPLLAQLPGPASEAIGPAPESIGPPAEAIGPAPEAINAGPEVVGPPPPVGGGRSLPQQPQAGPPPVEYFAPGAVGPRRLPPEALPPPVELPTGPAAPQGRRLRIMPRGQPSLDVESRPSGRGDEQITTITGGVQLFIDGVTTDVPGGLSTIDVSCDRMVIWSSVLLDVTREQVVDAEETIELYVEGNIIFREGDRQAFANRLYYDVNRQVGIILDGELITPVPNDQGLIRVQGPVVQQVGPDVFRARDAFFTTSLLGRPTYRWEAGEIVLEDFRQPLFDPATGRPAIDPATGEPVVARSTIATSTQNFLYLGEVPVLYWPRLSADLRDLDIFINRLRFRSDEVFGQQVLIGVDMYDALGIQRLPGTEWDARLDFFSERGVGHGTNYLYEGDEFLGVPSEFYGLIDFWGIDDAGRDNLGLGRRSLLPEEDYRYRLLGRHRHRYPDDIQVTLEVGLISDRNFLEQYYEQEWDNNKDQDTGLEIKQLNFNRSWTLWTDVRVNDFFTETEWLPRADHFWLGQSLLGDRLTYYEHTSVGFARLEPATTPTDPADAAAFQRRPWEEQSTGERFVTTHELDAPFEAGPFKIVPYALGQFAHWGEDLTGNDLQRAYGQAGVRASIPFWAVFNDVESDLFNVHGLAHKVTLQADAFYAEATEDVNQLPLYDEIDDNNIEHFRRRFAVNTFGGAIPPEFDERFYALRRNLIGDVTSPSAELADDFQAVRLDLNQRWQTKRGRPGNREIVDWITLNTGITYFPDPAGDNFGEELGLATYDLRWNLGNRFSLFSDGAFDFFSNGQRMAGVGIALSRPPRGQLSLSFRTLEGPITSQALTLAYDYQLSPKWTSTYAAFFDLGPGGNVGQRLLFTRIGESFLIRFGFSYDESTDNFGINLGIEPRFLLPGAAQRRYLQ